MIIRYNYNYAAARYKNRNVVYIGYCENLGSRLVVLLSTTLGLDQAFLTVFEQNKTSRTKIRCGSIYKYKHCICRIRTTKLEVGGPPLDGVSTEQS